MSDAQMTTDVAEQAGRLDRFRVKFQRRLMGLAKKLMGGDILRAEECLQRTWLAVCESPERVLGASNGWAYVAKIMLHVRNEMAREAGRGGLSTLLQEDILQSKEPQPDEAVSLMERATRSSQLIARARTALPPDLQRLLDLKIEGKQYSEIAELLGCTAHAVGAMVQRMFAHLRQIMNEEDYLALLAWTAGGGFFFGVTSAQASNPPPAFRQDALSMEQILGAGPPQGDGMTFFAGEADAGEKPK